MPNFFDRSDPPQAGHETFDTLCQTSNVKVERVLSNRVAGGEWYDQENDEWVMLVCGEAVLEFDGGEMQRLKAGDHLFIPARRRHRVLSTSADASWLAVHIKIAD